MLLMCKDVILFVFFMKLLNTIGKAGVLAAAILESGCTLVATTDDLNPPEDLLAMQQAFIEIGKGLEKITKVMDANEKSYNEKLAIRAKLREKEGKAVQVANTTEPVIRAQQRQQAVLVAKAVSDAMIQYKQDVKKEKPDEIALLSQDLRIQLDTLVNVSKEHYDKVAQEVSDTVEKLIGKLEHMSDRVVMQVAYYASAIKNSIQGRQTNDIVRNGYELLAVVDAVNERIASVSS